MLEKSKPYVIVLGNEKGGTGKSTTAMHLVISLLKSGYSVCSIDVDARQGTLTRYIENREKTRSSSFPDLLLPNHTPLFKATDDSSAEAKKQDEHNLEKLIENNQDKDFIVIDTPGNDTYLSRYAHSFADTLITPMNDSFVDLDVISNIKGEASKDVRPSIYAEWVWEEKKRRIMRDRGNIDWIVVRNRLANIHSRNREKIEKVLNNLAKRLSFRVLDGLSERVIFKELFPQGLTLLDLKDVGIPFTLSHVAARQELLTLMSTINLPTLRERLLKQEKDSH